MDVDIEKDGVRLSFGGIINHHEGGGIVFKFLAETLHSLYALHFLVLQEIGEHFEKVGFTASEEPGNPHADIRCVFPERFAIVIEESDEVFFEFLGDDIFIKLLDEDNTLVLIYFYHAVDFAVNILGEHIFNNHCDSSLYTILNAR